jgi:hypothetical protein
MFDLNNSLEDKIEIEKRGALWQTCRETEQEQEALWRKPHYGNSS